MQDAQQSLLPKRIGKQVVDKVRVLKTIGPIHPNSLEQLVVGLRLVRDLAEPLYGDVGGDIER